MIFVSVNIVVQLEGLALYHNARWYSEQVVNEQIGGQAGITESIPASPAVISVLPPSSNVPC